MAERKTAVKTGVRPLVAPLDSPVLRHRVRRGIRFASAFLFAGGELYCPCCERQLRKFLPATVGPGLICPACGSFERHRLLMAYLLAETDILSTPNRMLHFAPEQCLHDRFRAAPLLDYVTADIEHLPMVDVQADITQIPFPDKSFDIVLCTHVLEHVQEDRRALRELRRVLRPEGQALLQHPIDASRERTYEDPTITDPQQRLEAFGQRDHVRRYGRDFEDRVVEAGFSVECVPYRDLVPPEQVRRSALRDLGANRADDIYVCRPSAPRRSASG